MLQNASIFFFFFLGVNKWRNISENTKIILQPFFGDSCLLTLTAFGNNKPRYNCAKLTSLFIRCFFVLFQFLFIISWHVVQVIADKIQNFRLIAKFWARKREEKEKHEAPFIIKERLHQPMQYMNEEKDKKKKTARKLKVKTDDNYQ